MIVDGKKIIDLQLSATRPGEMRFANGQSTPITPVKQTPCPDGRALSLDGAWQAVRWPFKKPESALVSVSNPDMNWETVMQPGKVLYADPEADGKPFPSNWNRITMEHINDEDGAVIRRRVQIPAEWRGKRIILRFDSIYPAGRIYLNGDLLGEQVSGLTPVEFDVTRKVQPGTEALVAVRLLRKHKFLKMDMVRHSLEFAGLAQSACLFAVEPVMVDDYHLISSLSKKFDKGMVEGTIVVRSHAGAAKAALTVELLDDKGAVVAKAEKAVAVPPAGRAEAAVKLAVPAPKLWNDEVPNLYTVRMALRVAGQADQVITYRTGFRRLDLSPEGPRLNGNFIKFRGVNHLTFHPEHGMHTPKEWLRRCLGMMKKANVNCIRTHYLSPRDLCDLCDEMGFYLMQELPIDWGTNYIHDPEWVGPALLRIESGIRRDRHHPSLVVWSVGNENIPERAAVAEDGWNHLRIYDRFCKLLDPTRPTMFPPPGPANKIKGVFELRVGDIADTHYTFQIPKGFIEAGRFENPRSWEGELDICTRKQALARGWSGVWFSSEWCLFNMMPDLLNSPYASIIDDVQEPPFTGKNTLQVFQDRLDREWGFMRSERTCLGGAFFPWICASVSVRAEENPWGWMRLAEDNDWGVMCADLTPKPFFWAMRVAYSPVQFPKRLAWQKGQRDINFEIENHFNSIDFSQCTFRFQFALSSIWMTCIRPFTDIKVACPPGGKAMVRLNLPDEKWLQELDGGRSALVRCTVLDPHGFKVIVAETLVLSGDAVQVGDQAMPIGPDAPM
jgi:hypothetical protein